MRIRWQNPFEYFDEIYFINLDKRTDRLEKIQREFFSVGISNPIRIPGIEHENHAIGCHMAHAKIFNDALQEGYDRVLIFEDDLEFFPNAYLNMEKALYYLPPEWEMLYLGINMDRFKAFEISDHIARIEGGFATHAYAVRRSLFRKLYEINADTNTVHNDVTYSEKIHPYHQCYVTLPLIAGQREDYSDIQGKVMSSNQVFLSRLDSNLVRASWASRL